MSENESHRPLDDFDARLARARDKSRPDDGGNHSILRAPSGGFGMAFRVGVELVSALIVGVGIGLLLDRWLDTTPWFLVLFFFLGAAAGVLNVYRAASGLGLAAGYRPAEEDTGKKDTDQADGSA